MRRGGYLRRWRRRPPAGSRLMSGNLVSSHRLPGTTARRVAEARRALRESIGVFNPLRWDAGELAPQCLRAGMEMDTSVSVDLIIPRAPIASGSASAEAA